MFRLLLIGLLFLISQTCLAQEADPATIYIDDFSVSLGDTNIPDEFWDNGADFDVRKDNSVKAITVTGEEICTYQNIHVGDSINKVRSKYLLELDRPDALGVLLSGNQELDLEDIEDMDDAEYTDEIKRAILIEYGYVDGKVTQILINQVATLLDLDLEEADEEEHLDLKLTRDQVYVDGTILTYNEPVPDTLKKYAVQKLLGADLPDDAPLMIVTNNDGIVRCISILDSSVWTYDGIRVGMSIDSVKEKYEKYIDMSRSIDLYYQEDELLEMDDFPAEEYFLYSYYNDEKKIDRILICDNVYAKVMK